MNYLESRNVRIYIHDSAKDVFHELEDLKEVKDRSVLRVYEQDLENGSWQPVGGQRAEHPRILNQQVNQELIAAAAASGKRYVQPGMPSPSSGQKNSNVIYSNTPASSWMMNDDPSYFSEPEFEGMSDGRGRLDQQQQHNLHRSRKERASFGPGNSMTLGRQPLSSSSQVFSNSGPSSLPVNSPAQSQYYGTIIIPAYRTAAMMQQQNQQQDGQQQQQQPRPAERTSKQQQPQQTYQGNSMFSLHLIYQLL
jgi:hypothetical protein